MVRTNVIRWFARRSGEFETLFLTSPQISALHLVGPRPFITFSLEEPFASFKCSILIIASNFALRIVLPLLCKSSMVGAAVTSIVSLIGTTVFISTFALHTGHFAPPKYCSEPNRHSRHNKWPHGVELHYLVGQANRAFHF